MNFKRRLVMAALVIAFVSAAARAEEQLPQVLVSAQVSGSPFKNLILESDVPRLLQVLEAHFVEAEPKAHPCVEWRAGDERRESKPRTQLTLLFERVKYYNSFKIRLSYQVPLSKKLPFIVMTPIEEIPRPTGYQQVLKILTEKMDEELAGDELQAYLTTELIRRLPITSVTLAVERDEHTNDERNKEEKDQRVVIPINATRLRLAPDSPLFVDIKGQPFCGPQPEDCEVKLLFLGPSRVQPLDVLWCIAENSDCCRPLPPAVARKLQEVRNKQVFLGEDHRHCPPYRTGCRYAGLAREIGSLPEGGSR
jgi:hypothetical protein